MIKNTNLNHKRVFFLVCALLIFTTNGKAQKTSKTINADQVFNYNKKVILSDKFKTDFKKWIFSVDANYDDNSRPTSTDRVRIVNAPNLQDENAVQFIMPGTAGTFRSELSSAHEKGLQERWYGEKVYIETAPTNPGGYIVMQWHALMGKERVDRDFPNLAISVNDKHWEFATAYGSPADIQRGRIKTDDILVAKEWNNIVVHVKWSVGQDGLIQIWINSKLVMNQTGQNIYDGLTNNSPYFKTGIYRPQRKHTIDAEPPTIVYATDIKIGDKYAVYNDVAPL